MLGLRFSSVKSSSSRRSLDAVACGRASPGRRVRIGVPTANPYFGNGNGPSGDGPALPTGAAQETLGGEVMQEGEERLLAHPEGGPERVSTP